MLVLSSDVVDGHIPLDEQVVGGAVQLVRVDAETDRERALRVEVDAAAPGARARPARRPG